MSRTRVSPLKRVAFFGDAHTKPEEQDYKDAFEAAKLLAENGYAIVDGGGPGIMDAATQGAEEVNGETIAVTFAPKDTSSFEGRYLINLNKVDKEVITSNYIERMFKLIELSDMFLIFRGGSGTLSEFGTAWVLANIYYGHHKPFILYGDYWREIIDVLVRNMNIDEQELNCFEIATSSEEVLKAIHTFQWKSDQIDHTNCKVCAERAFMT